jgi:hypothetical protein
MRLSGVFIPQGFFGTPASGILACLRILRLVDHFLYSLKDALYLISLDQIEISAKAVS